jgi:hypothetical protein
MRDALKGSTMFTKSVTGGKAAMFSAPSPTVNPRGGIGGGVAYGIFGTGKTPMPSGDTPHMPVFAKGPGSTKINCPTGKCPGATRVAKL